MIPCDLSVFQNLYSTLTHLFDYRKRRSDERRRSLLGESYKAFEHYLHSGTGLGVLTDPKEDLGTLVGLVNNYRDRGLPNEDIASVLWQVARREEETRRDPEMQTPHHQYWNAVMEAIAPTNYVCMQTLVDRRITLLYWAFNLYVEHTKRRALVLDT